MLTLLDFKQFVEDRKFTNHDVAFFLGYGHQHVYCVLTGRSKATERFMLRAKHWMNDELQREADKQAVSKLKIKARDKVPNTSIEASREATRRWNEKYQGKKNENRIPVTYEPSELAEVPFKQRIILKLQQIKEMIEAL